MPDWKAPIASRLSALRLRPEREREIVDELSQHLTDRYEELRAQGNNHEQAMTLALDEIDDSELLAREMRPLRQASAAVAVPAGLPARRLAPDIWQDAAYAWRQLRRSPGLTSAIVLTLALGIGANTAVFSLVNAVLLQPLPVQNRDRLFQLFRGNGGGVSLSYPAYAAVRDGAQQVERLVAWGRIGASLNADSRTDLVSGAIVTGAYFEVLGLNAHRGRLLNADDNVTPGAHPVAVISHRLWRGRFGARSDIVGHQIHLNGQPFSIVGVTPDGFPGAELGVWNDLYVPMMMQPLMRPPRAGFSGEMNPNLLNNPNNGWLDAIALLKPGVAVEQARAELDVLMTAALPPAARSGLRLVSIDHGDPNAREALQSVAILLMAVVSTVLLIACANIAHLLLSRAASRRREVAIRLALGASRGRVIRQLLTESVMIGAIGGAAGLLLALALAQWFRAVPPPPGALPIALAFAIDQRVLLFTFLLSLATGIACGLGPAVQASKPAIVPSLTDEAFIFDHRARRWNVRNALVVAQVALAMLLSIGAGLFIRSLEAIRAVDPGMATSELVTAPLTIELLRYTRVQGRQFYANVLDRVQQLPGVRAATLTRVPLLAGGGRMTVVRVEGREPSHSANEPPGPQDMSFANVIGPGFFATTGVQLIRGRDFAAQDLEQAPLVAIVTEAMAEKFFPGEDPIGRRFSTGFSNASGPWTEIVGIARDSKYRDLAERPTAVVYMPLSQRYESGVALYVRSSGPLDTLIPAVRREIQRLEPNLPIPEVRSMEDAIGTLLYPQRMGTTLLTVFGGLAVLLACLGVYGVLAFSVDRRRRELGVRMAVGADRRSIFTLVIREGFVLVAIGLAIGLLGAVNLAQLLQRFLFQTSAHDALTFAGVALVLTIVALAACYVPARRAMRVDPIVALRS